MFAGPITPGWIGQSISSLAEVIGHLARAWTAPCISIPIRIADDGAGDHEVTAPILKRCPRVIEIPPTSNTRRT